MPDLFAYSEQQRNPKIRHLRRDQVAPAIYKRGMKLRIKQLRKSKGWTVEQLADVVNLSKSYVSESENGKKQANQDRIQKFADAFGVKVYDLLDQDNIADDERQLLSDFASMSAENRSALIAVAKSMRDKR